MLCALAAALLVAPVAQAGPSLRQRSLAREALASIVERVDHTTAYRYGAKDDRGARLDGLKVIQVDGTNLGVYHARAADGRFTVYLATSDDLIRWKRRTAIDVGASQPTLALMPGGGLVVAYEKVSLIELGPLDAVADTLESVVGPILNSPTDRIRIRFRYYRNVDALLHGQFAREFTAPRRLSPTAEGTPSITNITQKRGLVSRSRIEVGLHYFADLNGDGKSDADRLATGVLTGFNKWQARPAPYLDSELQNAPFLHAEYTTPPRGNIGDRDQIVLDGVRLELQEAQYVPGDYSSWRPFLIDPRGGFPRPLQIVTAGGSKSFGNPTATALTAPSGRPAVLVTVYVFSEGAAPGEIGPLIYYRER
ncbi:MAG: hypothetical protein QOJ46_2766 [bacterium]